MSFPFQSILSEQQQMRMALFGALFNPASRHFNNGGPVTCDHCGEDITAAVAYGFDGENLDLCRKCREKILQNASKTSIQLAIQHGPTSISTKAATIVKLLYCLPKNTAKEPINDRLVQGMDWLVKEAKRNKKTGTFSGYNASGNQFMLKGEYKGFHRCVCGAESSDCEYLITRNVATNSLAAHYLQYHRDEICDWERIIVEWLIEMYVPESVFVPDSAFVSTSIFTPVIEPKPMPIPDSVAKCWVQRTISMFDKKTGKLVEITPSYIKEQIGGVKSVEEILKEVRTQLNDYNVSRPIDPTGLIKTADDVVFSIVKIYRDESGSTALLLQISSKNGGAARAVAFPTQLNYYTPGIVTEAQRIKETAHASQTLKRYLADTTRVLADLEKLKPQHPGKTKKSAADLLKEIQ
jgi:hypothetical protein